MTPAVTAEKLLESLRAYIDASVIRYGSTAAIKPGHRTPFHWPPSPVSYSFHVLASDWTGKAEFTAYGETFSVSVATTIHGVFGRCDKLWHEARGDTVERMLQNLRDAAEPLFQRQLVIAETLHQEGRFTGQIRDLPLEDLLKLLYCRDRDVANDARIEIETHASLGVFCAALIEVLNDRRHPYRRSAQWCVLDLFEDLISFCHEPEHIDRATRAMRDLLWSAEDDYARTTFKAGVVLGGHLPDLTGGPLLIECLQAPSAIGRRSAIHGLFHVVEWHPESRARVVEALKAASLTDPEPLLRTFAAEMADDIENSRFDHIAEPTLAGE